MGLLDFFLFSILFDKILVKRKLPFFKLTVKSLSVSNWYHLGPPWKLVCSPCPYLYLVLYLLIENYYNRSHLKSFYVADFLSFFIYWGGNTPIIYYFIIYIKGKFLPMCSKYIHTGVVCSCILGLVWFLFLFS